jgi:hypothetical protein
MTLPKWNGVGPGATTGNVPSAARRTSSIE